MMVTAAKRETGVSGAFLKLPLRIWSLVWGQKAVRGCSRQLLATDETVGSSAAGMN